MKKKIKLIVKLSNDGKTTMSFYNRNGTLRSYTGMDGVEHRYTRNYTGKILTQTEVGKTKTVFEYDGNDNMISRRTISLCKSPHEVLEAESCRYDQRGNIIEKVITKDGKSFLDMMEYNENNLLVSMKSHVYSSGQLVKTNYNNADWIDFNFLSTDPVDTTLYKYAYDTNNNLITVDFTREDITNKQIMIYDKFNRLISELIYNIGADGRIINPTTPNKWTIGDSNVQDYIAFYFENGTLDVGSCGTNDGIIVNNYQYNDNGDVISYDGNCNGIRESIRNTHDDIGNLIKSVQINSDGTVIQRYCEYNENNDIVSEVLKTTDKNDMVKIFTIETVYLYY